MTWRPWVWVAWDLLYIASLVVLGELVIVGAAWWMFA